MLLPLYDKNPKTRIKFQYVTVTLITLSSLAFLYQLSLGDVAGYRLILGLGAIPAVIFGNNELAPGLVMVPTSVTLLTSMFLHDDWMHLIGNMVFLWVLGDNIEDAMGHTRFIAFYALCGIIAAIAHGAIDPLNEAPMIGASGAISGVIGAYLLLHPKAPIHTLVFYYVIAIPAWIVLGLWIGIQFFNVLQGGGGNVAWWAHIGGIVAGIALIPLFKSKDVPLLAGLRGDPATSAEPARKAPVKSPRGIRIMRVVKKNTKNEPTKGPWN